jgi:secondary thiamine-phosphate synthase enzyme
VNPVVTPHTTEPHVSEGLLRVVTGAVEFSSRGNADIVRITDEVRERVAESGVRNGTVTVFAPGATGAITTIEYEPGVIQDVQDVLEKLAPSDRRWQHNINNGDGNGHSHIRAALVGPSVTVPVVDGHMTLGTWQELAFCDFDARPRQRSVVVQVMGV